MPLLEDRDRLDSESLFIRVSTISVTQLWPILRPMIAVALPMWMAKGEEVLANIMQSILASRMQCWLFLTGTYKIRGVVLTTFSEDSLSGLRFLVIYTVSLTKELTKADVVAAGRSLKTYAKAKDCSAVVTETKSPDMLGAAKELGADTGWRHIVLEV